MFRHDGSTNEAPHHRRFDGIVDLLTFRVRLRKNAWKNARVRPCALPVETQGRKISLECQLSAAVSGFIAGLRGDAIVFPSSS